ncbi:sigma 54-interacting transcriptional regulator [Desulforhopalus singaporensis]|uniref:HTH-type transcriptional regulatory protein TyrR n=1 Tax=Desulforhopalus singaporensis TaxID=91360 RepID=A0A1H0KDU6_9BACT|nr:sigma 54-interacting transcriptional regulator [Desulforhopalus singaporensis]SDO54006.1 PAS domain S-box-containing protein [Desulforhopalus singaporensis]
MSDVISNDKRMEQLEKCLQENSSLQRQNEQLKAALQQVPIGVMISSGSDNSVLMMNQEMERMIGISRELIIGRHFAREFHGRGGKISYTGENGILSDSFARHSLSSNHLIVKDCELLIHRPDGEEIVVSMSSSPILGANQEIMAIISILSDVTERKKQENFYKNAKERLEVEVQRKTRDLKDMNSQLETIFNNSSESLWVCDGQGVVISVNKASEKLHGLPEEDAIGRYVGDLVDEGFIDQSVTGKVLKTGEQTTIIQKVNRTGKQLLVTGTPVFDDDGKITMVIINERDLTRLNELQRELQQAKEETDRFKVELSELHLQDLAKEEIIAYSRQMQDILLVCRKLANMAISNILILGESGTGKSMLAKYLHTSSSKRKGPFVKINCAALPESLLEAELFGYEKGAFTGARDQGKIGLFELANDGTIFLDEIGELPISLQAKLLHCLEEKEIMHLGGLEPISINCTVIAATNVDLAGRVRERKFRKDLFFRLNTFPITIPPLRERSEDILELSLYFLNKYNEKYNANRQLTSEELDKIQAYPFPGNVRELKNILKKMIVLADNSLLSAVSEGEAVYAATDKRVKTPGPVVEQSLKKSLAEYEKSILEHALNTYTTTRTLAKHLEISQSQVVRKLSEHDLSHRLKRNRG